MPSHRKSGSPAEKSVPKTRQLTGPRRALSLRLRHRHSKDAHHAKLPEKPVPPPEMPHTKRRK